MQNHPAGELATAEGAAAITKQELPAQDPVPSTQQANVVTPAARVNERSERLQAVPVATTERSIEPVRKAAALAAAVPEAGREAPTKPDEFRGVIKKEDIRKTIKELRPGIGACYESALKLDPSLGGKIRITFEIEARDGYGKVVSGEVTDSELRSPFFEACVLEKVVAAKFPEPRGGKTKVVYPFSFDPGIGWGGAPPQ